MRWWSVCSGDNSGDNSGGGGGGGSLYQHTLVNVRMSVASRLNCGLSRQFNFALEIEIEFKLDLRS